MSSGHPSFQFIAWHSAQRFLRKFSGRIFPDGLRQRNNHSSRLSDISTIRRSPSLVIAAGKSMCVRSKSNISHSKRADSSGRRPAKQPTVIIGTMSIGGMRIEIAPNFFRQAAFSSSWASTLKPSLARVRSFLSSEIRKIVGGFFSLARSLGHMML